MHDVLPTAETAARHRSTDKEQEQVQVQVPILVRGLMLGLSLTSLIGDGRRLSMKPCMSGDWYLHAYNGMQWHVSKFTIQRVPYPVPAKYRELWLRAPTFQRQTYIDTSTWSGNFASSGCSICAQLVLTPSVPVDVPCSTMSASDHAHAHEGLW